MYCTRNDPKRPRMHRQSIKIKYAVIRTLCVCVCVCVWGGGGGGGGITKKIKGQYMNRSPFWMIKYMNGSVFSKARYMNGVGFEILWLAHPYQNYP